MHRVHAALVAALLVCLARSSPFFGRRFLRRLNPPRIGGSHSGYVALVEDTWYLLRNFSPFTPIFCGFLWVKVMSRPRENRAIFLKASDPGELRGFIA